MEITVLGSGTSMGIPVVGCHCAVCRSTDPRDKRTRSSVLIKVSGKTILIDTSIDFRTQALREDIQYLDAVLFTHHHVDHILGLDDLRSLTLFNHYTIPIYASGTTLQNIRRVFAYIFDDTPAISDIPRIRAHEIDERPFSIGGVSIVPIPIMHGPLPILGFRIGDFAYCTDVSDIPEKSLGLLQNLQVLILGALRYKPHPTHFNFEQAVATAQKIGAKQTFFTHIAHQVSHAEAIEKLPDGISLAYDGMRIIIE